jgi:D-sedoheptulose 7-phosphate isomerase
MREIVRSQTKQLAATFLQEFEDLLHKINLDALERVFEILKAARMRGATIYIAGNGGSAATASHWVNDLGKGAKVNGGAPMRVISLSDNVSWLTALANDEGYERSFAGQLENFAEPGDVLIVLSASGNSVNLLRAVELAGAREVTTIGLLGFDGGALKGMVDEYLLLPTAKGAYGLVESGHDLLCHILTACLAADQMKQAMPLARAVG